MSRSVTRRRAAAVVGAALSAGIVLAACGSADDGGADGDAPQAAAQDLTIGPGTFPASLDVHQYSSETAVIGPMQHVLETLVTQDGDDFEPLLAESWENPDELTWVFHIDPDATFSDGSPVTADDVRASGERVIETGGSLAPLWEPVEELEATDEKTLTVTTEEPLGTFLNTASLLLVGQGENLEQEDYWRSPVGSGPFVVEDYRADERLTLARNDDYWGQAPALDTLTLTNIPEEAARITALSSGEIDVMTGVSPDSVTEVSALDGVVYEEMPSYAYQLVWFNSSREPLDDERVRQAMWHAVDVESIVGDLFGTRGTLAQAPIPQSVFGAPELDPYPYDPDLARELLEEAGYADGFSTSLQWSDASGEDTRSLAQAFISDWAEVGIEVEPLAKERAVWLEDLNDLNWDMNLQGNNVATGDADYTLGRLYLCEANRMGYCNEDLDDLLTQARQSLDQDERADLYEQASRIIWEEAVGIFPMDRSTAIAFSDRVQGLELDPGERTSYRGVSLTE